MNGAPVNPAPQTNPSIRKGELCVILATRGRPELLCEMFESLRANTARKDLTSVWLYIDEDDQVTREAIEKKIFPDPGMPVNWYVGPQTGGLGQPHQVLWNASNRTAQVYVTSVDDARFDTSGWDDIVRTEYDRFPDGVLLAFPHDPMTADQATYPIFGWGWLQVLGSVYTGYFPYWFEDKWVDQVGRMAGRCVKLAFDLPPIRGKGRTKRMRNLPFWTRFFQLTLDERKDVARKLIDAIHPEDGSKRREALAALETAAMEFAKEEKSFSDLYCIFQEERHTELTDADRQKFDEKYFSTEARAVARLISRARELVQKKEYTEAMTFLDAVQLSDMKVRQANALMSDCLRGLGRVAEADRISSETNIQWPQMNPLRRGFRFLGMVANDGKRMLVGLTSKGKKG
jgi:hypothetical protein